MKKFLLTLFLIGSINTFASQNWKSAGEHFENRYLAELQEKLKESDLFSTQRISVLPLKQAFLIYLIEAQKGDIDAQFRLGTLYEQNGFSKEAKSWFEKAAVGGHEYAIYRLGKNTEPIDEEEDCRHHSYHLLNGTPGLATFLFHVESLALLGQGRCRTDFGRYKKSPYWLRSALFTPSVTVSDGYAFYHLGLFLEKSLEPDDQLVLSSMERAAFEGSKKAYQWLEARTSLSGRMAFGLFAQDTGETILADALFKYLGQKPVRQARYQNTAFKNIQPYYHRDLKRALKNLERLKNQPFVLEVIEHLSAVFKPEFADSILSLYRELGDYRAPDQKILDNTLAFLKSPKAKRVGKGKQFKMIENSLRIGSVIPDLTRDQELVHFVTSLVADLSLQQLLSALNLRHFLASSFDVTELDGALNRILNRIPSDEARLKSVLQITQESQNRDLLVFCFHKLLSNELQQADILMYLEDLFQSGRSSSSGRSATLKVVQILARSSLTDSDLGFLEGFPKLKILKGSGIFIPVLDTYIKALQNYNFRGFYFWENLLAATLSPGDLKSVEGHFGSTLGRLSGSIHEFENNKAKKENLEDAGVAKKLEKKSLESSLSLKKNELKHRLFELKTMQDSLREISDYTGDRATQREQLKTSAGLQVFQRIERDLKEFYVSPANSEMSLESNRLGKLAHYAHRFIELKKGEVLNLQVSGEWSPICALKRSGLKIDTSRILINSEGFREQLLSGEGQNTGNDKRDSTATFSADTATTGFRVDLGISFFGSGFGVSHSASHTEGRSQTSEKSKYEQNSKFQSHTAAFQAGYRLKHTPYPEFPAGAYLAIVVPQEIIRNTEIIHSTVLQAHTSIIAAEDSKVYFVVNDCNDGNSQTGSLMVRLQKLEPTDGIIAALLDDMDKQLRTFSRKGENLIYQGGDLGFQIDALKSHVIAELKKNHIVNFMSEPTLYSVFLDWLNFEAVKIINKAKIIDLSRRIYTLNLEIDNLNQQLEIHSEHKEHLLSRQSLLVKHGYYIPLYNVLLETLQEASLFLLPIRRLYHSNKVVSATETHDGNLDLLTMALKVKSIIGQMVSYISFDVNMRLASEYVVVRIRRPGLELPASEKKKVPILSPERAKIFWDHLFIDVPNEHNIGLKLEFEDLYHQSAISGKLLVTEENPFIVDMVLLFGHTNPATFDDLKNHFFSANIDMLVGSEQNFPLEQGPEKYILASHRLRNHKISIGLIDTRKLMKDSIGEVVSEVNMIRNTAKGLSPFTTYNFARHSPKIREDLREQLKVGDDGYPNDLSDVFLVMKVVSNKCEHWIKWIDCQR